MISLLYFPFGLATRLLSVCDRALLRSFSDTCKRDFALVSLIRPLSLSFRFDSSPLIDLILFRDLEILFLRWRTDGPEALASRFRSGIIQK